MKYMNEGEPVTLTEMLGAREARAHLLEELCDRFPKETILCFKLNIPGPVKNNEAITGVFDEGVRRIKEILRDPAVASLTNDRTGPELILRTPEDARAVKEKMIALEEASPIGRLYDIDVLNKGTAVSRETLGRPERRCLICAEPAKVCARSRAHTVEAMLETIEALIEEDPHVKP